MKKTQMIFILISLSFLISCTKDEMSDLDGKQSQFGAVGNEIHTKAGQLGITDADIYVSKLENGISTFTCSGSTSNSKYIELIKIIPSELFPGTIEVTGNTVRATINVKITDNGSQLIFNDGSKLNIVKYDAKVGDKYTTKVGKYTLENEVIEKSTDDDYMWGGMLIKIIRVRSKSVIPGVSYVEHVYNHKFGFVGVAIHFEDGSVKYVGIEC